MPRWKTGKPHPKPFTDEERLDDGQKRFELRDENGVLIDYVYRHYAWQANRVFKYHIQRIKRQREERRKGREYINNLLAEHRKKLLAEQLQRQHEQGLDNLNTMTLFELHDLLE